MKPERRACSGAHNFSILVALLTAIFSLFGGAAFARSDDQAAAPVVSNNRAFVAPDQTSPLEEADLRIGPFDKLNIKFFGVESLSGDYQVDQQGYVKFPLVGDLDVKGYTASELAVVLEKQFGEKYLQTADVNVMITDSSNGLVTLEGAVAKPGMYPIKGNLSLLQAVALGGGPSDKANRKKVLVFRNIEGQRHAAVFNLMDIRKGKAEDPRIYGNDVVVVDGSRVTENYREVLRSIPIWALFVAF